MADIAHYSEGKQDVALTNLVIDYGNNMYIADDIFPIVSVKNDKDIFYKWNRKAFNTAGLDTRRADRARAKEISVGLSQDNYVVEQHALADFIEDSILKNVDSMLNLMERTAENIIDTLDLVKEIEAKDLLFAAGTYAATNKVTLAANDRWSQINHADSDPQEDIVTAKEAVLKQSGVIPNILVMGYQGFNMLKRHAKVKESVKYVAATGDAQMTKKAIADFLGVDDIWVGTAIYNSAKEGQADSPAFVWATHAALIYHPGGGVAINKPMFACQFRPSHTPRTVERWRENGRKGEFIEVNEKRVLKVLFANSGYLFINAFDVA